MRRSENQSTTANRRLAWIEKYRIFLLFAVIFVFMSAFAPRFFNVFNLTSILRMVAMNATVAIGFTIVLICAQLDLSIGTVITFAGVVGLSLKEPLGYALAVPIAIAAGAMVGLFNGVLVAKAKISSFIVTLGTLTILQGAIYTITGGNTISLSTPDAFAVSDFLARPLLPLLTPRILLMLGLVAAFELFLRRTRTGRNFYLVGGNKNTAWLAGINTDRYLIAAFVLSGTLAATGGIFFAMESSAATLRMGDQSLMYVISATIIGGTAMTGGKGGVLRSFVAVLALEMLYTGVILFGLGNEVKIFIAGLILAAVVLYEAYAYYKHQREIGKRPELIRELAVQTAAAGEGGKAGP